MERLGTKILELHKIHKAWPSRVILDGFTYNFNRKERLGIVGNNGTGKSTFLNMIQELEPVDKGTVSIGETVVFGYYNQELIKVDDDKKVIDVIRDIAEYIPLEKGKQMTAAQFLEKFLFPRDMHYNFVYKLSGGEKRRLKLMTVLMKNPNFLILDEPTNDLDIFVMSVLEDYLRTFEGCLIVVSHDRYFMDKMVDHIFVFEGQGKIKDIVGNYTEYRQMLQEGIKQDRQDKADAVKQQKQEAAAAPKPVVQTPQPEKKKLSFKEKQEFDSLEKELEVLETEKEKFTLILSDGTKTNDEIMEAGSKLGEIVQAIESKTERWLELAEGV
jgi:ATP-binding cassette subfamily F protein uup